MNQETQVAFAKLKWIFLAVLLGLAVLATVGWAKKNTGRLPAGQTFTQKLGRDENQNCHSNKAPVFTAEFIDRSQLDHLAPIGGVIVGSPARSYIVAKKDAAGKFVKVPIYAPTEMTLSNMVFARRGGPSASTAASVNAPGEYRLDFLVSCEVTLHYDHIDEVADPIKALAPKEPASNTRDGARVSLPIKAGDLLGYSNGTEQSGGFDFYLLNSSKPAAHINPKRWQWGQTTIADCPYDYFMPELKTQYYNMFRSQDGQPLTTPSCGSPSHDKAGTLSGGWFQGESTDAQGKWLEIGTQNTRAELLIRENGNHVFGVRDYTAEVKPEDVTVGQSVCYSEPGKWAFAKLTSVTNLQLATGSGSCPTSFPDGQAEAWER